MVVLELLALLEPMVRRAVRERLALLEIQDFSEAKGAPEQQGQMVNQALLGPLVLQEAMDQQGPQVK